MDEANFKRRFYKDNLAQYNKADERTENLWGVLQNIEKHFKSFSKRCEDAAKRLMADVLEAKELLFIHSVRYRVKDSNSLLKKFIKKKAELPISPPTIFNEAEKYRDCNDTNYFKIVTDLGGVRILIRYRSEWEMVDAWVRKHFREQFVVNWDTDYQSAPMENFLAEKPKVYYKHSEEDYYGQFDKNKFELNKSIEEYNSIHYIINYNGTYVELQVRTILDEAWGECTHDIIYKGAQTDKEMKIMAKCLSEQIKAAETITEIIYDKMHPKKRKRSTTVSNETNVVDDSALDDEDEIIKRKKIIYCKKLDNRLKHKKDK